MKVTKVCVGAIAVILAACATNGESTKIWAANGYLTPGPTGAPNVIGEYADRSDCLEAAENWASRQVVGNPVFTECLPMDRD
ncbi:MAG: hypothetical protein AAGB02_06250 [Pseudomonadota bacterium]